MSGADDGPDGVLPDLDAVPRDLDAVELRVLGCLLEKQVAVPAAYPLTANALRAAANQTSSRDPVTDHDEATLTEALRSLKERSLVRPVWAGKGARTLKYHQLLTEVLGLSEAERALLTVLLLRGPQSVGELRTRTERLHVFGARDEVEATLRAMADAALVRELPRRAGQQDHRWVHLLGAASAAEPVAAAPVDRERPLADGVPARDERVRAGWDADAAAYAERYADELTTQPFEIWLLEHFAGLVGPAPVVEVGCGPGHIAAFLADAGVDVTGFDLSPAMVAEATRRYPDLPFAVGHQQQLLRPRTAHGWGGVVSFYSTVHLAASELEPTAAAWHRVLAEGGRLLLAVRAGAAVREVGSELTGPGEDGAPLQPVLVVLHDPAQVLAAVAAAGFVDVQWFRRGPTAGSDAAGSDAAGSDAAGSDAEERLFILARRD